jgi:hypothetical protein
MCLQKDDILRDCVAKSMTWAKYSRARARASLTRTAGDETIVGWGVRVCAESDDQANRAHVVLDMHRTCRIYTYT